jgi:hypothetical protein
VRREEELKAQIEKAPLMKAMKASFAGKPQKLNDGGGNNCGAVFKKVQKNTVGYTSQKLNDSMRITMVPCSRGYKRTQLDTHRRS